MLAANFRSKAFLASVTPLLLNYDILCIGFRYLLHRPHRPICQLTHSLTAALDQLRVVASSTSNDPGPRSRQHQQIGQCLLPIAAANSSMDNPAGASSQQREECRCGHLSTVVLNTVRYLSASGPPEIRVYTDHGVDAK